MAQWEERAKEFGDNIRAEKADAVKAMEAELERGVRMERVEAEKEVIAQANCNAADALRVWVGDALTRLAKMAELPCPTYHYPVRGPQFQLHASWTVGGLAVEIIMTLCERGKLPTELRINRLRIDSIELPLEGDDLVKDVEAKKDRVCNWVCGHVFSAIEDRANRVNSDVIQL